MVTYAHLENADPEILSLFWLTLLEWNLPQLAVRTRSSRRVQMDELVLMTHRQEITTKTQIGMWLVTATQRSRPRAAGRWSTFVIKQDFAWATLGDMATRQLSLRCHLQATGSTTLLQGRNALKRLKSKLALNLARVFNSAHSVTMFRFMSDSHLRDVGEETGTGTLHAQDGAMLRYAGQ